MCNSTGSRSRSRSGSNNSNDDLENDYDNDDFDLDDDDDDNENDNDSESEYHISDSNAESVEQDMDTSGDFVPSGKKNFKKTLNYNLRSSTKAKSKSQAKSVANISPHSTTSRVSKSSGKSRKTKSTTTPRRRRSPTKKKKKAKAQARKGKHGFKTTDGQTIELTLDNILSMPASTQRSSFGHIVYVKDYTRKECQGLRDFLSDPKRLEHSFNSWDSTYLTKDTTTTTTVTTTGYKRPNPEKSGQPPKKKLKIATTAPALEQMSTNSGYTIQTTASTKSVLTQYYKAPLGNFHTNFIQYVPSVTFSKTILNYFMLPRIFSLRWGKRTQLWRFRTQFNGGKDRYFCTKDVVRTPFGGDLDFHFTVTETSAQLNYPDNLEWESKDQGTSAKKQTGYGAGIHRTVVNLELYYLTHDSDERKMIENYVSYLKETGLRPLDYYIACVKYWTMIRAGVNVKDENCTFFDNMEWVYQAAHYYQMFDKQLLVICCLREDFLKNCNEKITIDENTQVLHLFSTKCPIVGVHKGYEVSAEYAENVSEIDKLKHFGISKLCYHNFSVNTSFCVCCVFVMSEISGNFGIVFVFVSVCSLTLEEREEWKKRGLTHDFEHLFGLGMRYFWCYAKWIGVNQDYLKHVGLDLSEAELKNGIGFTGLAENLPQYDIDNPKTFEEEMKEHFISTSFSKNGNNVTAWDLIRKTKEFGKCALVPDYDKLAQDNVVLDPPMNYNNFSANDHLSLESWNRPPRGSCVDRSLGGLSNEHWFPNGRPYNHNMYESLSAEIELNWKYFIYGMMPSEYPKPDSPYPPLRDSKRKQNNVRKQASEIGIGNDLGNSMMNFNNNNKNFDGNNDSQMTSTFAASETDESEFGREYSITQTNLDALLENATVNTMAETATTNVKEMKQAFHNHLGGANLFEECGRDKFLGENANSEFILKLDEAFGTEGVGNMSVWDRLSKLSDILADKRIFLQTHDECVYNGKHDCLNIAKWYTKLSIYNIGAKSLRNQFLKYFNGKKENKCRQVLKQLKDKYKNNDKNELKSIWLTQMQRSDPMHDDSLKPYFELLQLLNSQCVAAPAVRRNAVNQTAINSNHPIFIGDFYWVSNHNIKAWHRSEILTIVDIDDQQNVLHCRKISTFGDSSYPLPKAKLDEWDWTLKSSFIHGTKRCGNLKNKDIVYIPDLRKFGMINNTGGIMDENGNLMQISGYQWSTLMIVIKNGSSDSIPRYLNVDYTNRSVFKHRLYQNEIIGNKNSNVRLRVLKYNKSSMTATLLNEKINKHESIGTGRTTHTNFVFIDRIFGKSWVPESAMDLLNKFNVSSECNYHQLTDFLQGILDCKQETMVNDAASMAAVVKNETIKLPVFTNNLTIDVDLINVYSKGENTDYSRLGNFVQHDKCKTWEYLILNEYDKFFKNLDKTRLSGGDFTVSQWLEFFHSSQVLQIILHYHARDKWFKNMYTLCNSDFASEEKNNSPRLEMYLQENLSFEKKEEWMKQLSDTINKKQKIQYNKEISKLLINKDFVEINEKIDWGLLCFGLLSDRIGFIGTRLNAFKNCKYGFVDNFDDLKNDNIRACILSGNTNNIHQAYCMYPPIRQLVDNIRQHSEYFDLITSQKINKDNLHKIENLVIDYVEFIYMQRVLPMIVRSTKHDQIMTIKKFAWLFGETLGNEPMYLTNQIRNFFINPTSDKKSIANILLKTFAKSTSPPQFLGAFAINSTIGTKNTGVKNVKSEVKSSLNMNDNDVQYVGERKDSDILIHTFTRNRWKNAMSKYPFLNKILSDFENLDMKCLNVDGNEEERIETRLAYKYFASWQDDDKNYLEKIFHNKYNVPTLDNKQDKEIAVKILVLACIVFYLEWITYQVCDFTSQKCVPLMKWDVDTFEQEYTTHEMEKFVENQTKKNEDGLNFWIKYRDAIISKRKQFQSIEWFENTREGQKILFQKSQTRTQVTPGGPGTNTQSPVNQERNENSNTNAENVTNTSAQGNTSESSNVDTEMTEQGKQEEKKEENRTEAGANDTVMKENEQKQKQQKQEEKKEDKNVKDGDGFRKPKPVIGKAKDELVARNMEQMQQRNAARIQNLGAVKITNKDGSNKSKTGDDAPQGKQKTNKNDTVKSTHKPKTGADVQNVANKNKDNTVKSKHKPKIGDDPPQGKPNTNKNDTSKSKLKPKQKLDKSQSPQVVSTNQQRQESSVKAKSESPGAHGEQAKVNVFNGTKYVSLSIYDTVRAFGRQPFAQQYKVLKIQSVEKTNRYNAIVCKVEDDVKKESNLSIDCTQLYQGDHLPLTIWYKPLDSWVIVGANQMVKINLEYNDLTKVLANPKINQWYQKFNTDMYKNEKGTVCGFGHHRDSDLIVVEVQFSKGSNLGKKHVPTIFTEIINYKQPKPAKMLIFKNFWKAQENIEIAMKFENISGIGGGDGAYDVVDYIDKICIRKNLESQDRVELKIGEFAYMYDDYYVMLPVKIHFIDDWDSIHVIKENGDRIIVAPECLLAEQLQVCVVWDAKAGFYTPIYFNQLLAYNGQYHHVFDAQYNFKSSKWMVCLRDTRDGDDAWIWVYNKDLTTTFTNDWSSKCGSFVCWRNRIDGGDAHSHSNSFLNTGDQLLKLLKHFNTNENVIRELVEDIVENGIDYDNVTTHKRFNVYGFAMKASKP